MLCRDVVHKMSKVFLLSSGEADVPGLQKRDLSNSQMGALTKSVLLYCTLCDISKNKQGKIV